MTARRTDPKKDQRKEFRKNINPPTRQGDSVVGSGCLMLLFPAVLGFGLVFVLGLFGLAVLLP